MKIFVTDTETTGFGKPMGLVQVAWIEIDNDINVLSEFETLVNPERSIEKGAEEVHGISAEMVQDAPTIDEVLFPEDPALIIGHNISYDMRVIGDRFANIIGTLCTLQLARKVWPDMPDHKLDRIAKRMKFPEEKDHDALGDVRKCIHILNWVRNEFEEDTISDMMQVLAKRKVLPRLGFGQYKGISCKQVPMQYWEWVLSCEDFDPDVIYTANYYLGR